MQFFLHISKKSLSNFEDTDIDCSMCSTILPSGGSSGTTLEVPSVALLHRSKLQSHVCAHTQVFWPKNTNKLVFYAKKFAYFNFFCVSLQPKIHHYPMRNTYSLLILSIFVSLVACTGSQIQYRIGMSQCFDDAWRQKMNDEMECELLLHPDFTQ